MGFYDNGIDQYNDEFITDSLLKTVQEMYLYQDLANMPDKQRNRILTSAEYSELRQAWMEAGLINKVSIMKLSKESDLERRQSSAVMALARERNDPDYIKYAKLKAETRVLKARMSKRYSSKAKLLGAQSQRAYIKQNGISNIVLSNT